MIFKLILRLSMISSASRTRSTFDFRLDFGCGVIFDMSEKRPIMVVKGQAALPFTDVCINKRHKAYMRPICECNAPSCVPKRIHAD